MLVCSLLFCCLLLLLVTYFLCLVVSAGLASLVSLSTVRALVVSSTWSVPVAVACTAWCVCVRESEFCGVGLGCTRCAMCMACACVYRCGCAVDCVVGCVVSCVQCACVLCGELLCRCDWSYVWRGCLLLVLKAKRMTKVAAAEMLLLQSQKIVVI